MKITQTTDDKGHPCYEWQVGNHGGYCRTLEDACNDASRFLVDRDVALAALTEIAQRGPVDGYKSAGAVLLRLVGSQSIARAAIATLTKATQ